MKSYSDEYIQSHRQEFFTYCNAEGKICPYKKVDVYDNINNFNEDSVKKWCKYFNIPFIREVWEHRRSLEYERYHDKIFGKYLSLMQLLQYKNLTYADSDRLNGEE